MKSTKTYAPALSVEQWRDTSIKRRIARVKDLKKYIAWCKQNEQSDFQIAFAESQIENIRQSLNPIKFKVGLKEQVDIALQDAVLVVKFGDLNNFKDVKTCFWKNRLPKCMTLGEDTEPLFDPYFFAVSYSHNDVFKCFALAESFSFEMCRQVNKQQIESLLNELLYRIKQRANEEQALIDVLN